MWIRNPRWDGFWLLSGLPLGVLLLLLAIWAPSFLTLCPPTSVMFMTPVRCNPLMAMSSLISIYAIVALDMGHNLAPMFLAWSHDGFRALMLKRPVRFIIVPIVLLALGTLAGIASSVWGDPLWTPFVNSALSASELWPPRITNTMWWLIIIYASWNYYHFAKQNFGVLSIYRLKSAVIYPENQRRIDLVFAFVVQTAVIGSVFLGFAQTQAISESTHLLYFLVVLGLCLLIVRDAAIGGRYWTPRVIFSVSQSLCLLFPGLMIVAANGINHWIVSIGLASHVDGRSHHRSPLIFASFIIIVGIAVFWALFWKRGALYSWNLRDMIDLALPYAGFRLALGFVHFLTDRSLYQFHKPEVRATIGRELLT